MLMSRNLSTGSRHRAFMNQRRRSAFGPEASARLKQLGPVGSTVGACGRSQEHLTPARVLS